MKINLIIIVCLLLLTGNVAIAQKFIESGTIEFEKSINTYVVIKRQIDLDKSNQAFYVPMFEQFKKTQPQFKILKSNLSFSKDKTLFEPVPPTDTKYVTFISNNPAFEQNNTIFTDLTAGSVVNQKQVYEQTFLVKDNARKITWKITDETREIAGYPCRRANGIMLDSVYVVAFYSISIPVSGGPESFSGLPGMILGVALPHENMSWFATKVNVSTSQTIKVPLKGKVTTQKDLQATLEGAVKNWGPSAKIIMKAFQL